MTSNQQKIRIIKELIQDYENQFETLEPTHIPKTEIVLRNIIEVAQSD